VWAGELGLAGQQLHLGQVQVPETGSLDTKKESGLWAGEQVAWTPRRKMTPVGWWTGSLNTRKESGVWSGRE
jgi:hypothetical protein